MMKADKLLEAIGEINDEAIRSAKVKNKPKSRKGVRLTSMAACLCLVVISAFAISKKYFQTPMGEEYIDAGDNSIDGNPNGYTPSPGSQASNDTEISEQDPAAQMENTESDMSPVYYSSLTLADGRLDEEALAFSESSVMDVKAFDESMLSQDHCCMIVEGTVVDLYVKHYTYDVYSDKFEENGILHGMTNTIIYEVAVDKTWYGGDISGNTILIEDTSYFTEPILAVKEGGRYVLPLYEYGDSIWTLGHEYAGGDITRETTYSTIYPYHPQIEVTNDGSYFVSQDWTTLTADNAREVIMDTLDDDDFWKDKMYLIDGNTFAERMAVLIDAIK